MDQLLPFFIGPGEHRPEFMTGEFPAVQSVPGLPIKGRPRAVDPDEKGDEKEDRGEEDD